MTLVFCTVSAGLHLVPRFFLSASLDLYRAQDVCYGDGIAYIVAGMRGGVEQRL